MNIDSLWIVSRLLGSFSFPFVLSISGLLAIFFTMEFDNDIIIQQYTYNNCSWTEWLHTLIVSFGDVIRCSMLLFKHLLLCKVYLCLFLLVSVDKYQHKYLLRSGMLECTAWYIKFVRSTMIPTFFRWN